MLDQNNNSDEASNFKKNLKDLQMALVNAAIVTQEKVTVPTDAAIKMILVLFLKSAFALQYQIQE